MPEYCFVNNNGQKRDIFYKIAEAPSVGTEITLDGEKWKRVFTIPQANIAVTIDPYSKTDFIKKTMDKTETLGDIFDRSAELSAKRAEKEGVDTVKEKFYSDYEKKTKGVAHPSKQKEQARKTAEETNRSKALKELGISIKVNV